MSENLQNLLKDALLNNSYDYAPMHDTLKHSWMNSYSYLYYYQKARISYEELFYFSNDEESRDVSKIGHLYLSKLSAAFDVDYDIIDNLAREAFRKSEFYSKEFTFEDMAYNPSIFYRVPLIIIDDKMIFDFKIKVLNDTFSIILPFGRTFVYSLDRKSPSNNEFIYYDHKIQVLIVPNVYYQRYTYNKTTLLFDVVNRTIKLVRNRMESVTRNTITNEVTRYYMEKFGVTSETQLTQQQLNTINKEVARRYKYVEIPETDGIMFVSLHFADNAGKDYYLGSAPIELERDLDGNFLGHLTDDLYDKIKNHVYTIYASVFFIPGLYKHTFYNGKSESVSTVEGSKIMVLEQSEWVPYASPVPVENFMVFKKNENDGWYLEKNTDMIDLYYPNLYLNKDANRTEGSTYKYYYFYHFNDDLKYTVMFEFYYRFLHHTFPNMSMEEIVNNIYYNTADLSMYNETQKETFKNIFNNIMNYSAFHYQYGDMDFLIRYLKTDGNSDKAPIEYKDETMKEWITEDPDILHDYVTMQNKLGSSYHLFTNTIDLRSRRRIDTETELGNKDIYTFDEPRYVFAFANERTYPTLLDCRVFVDGILIGDVYQRRKLYMDYFYIPTYMVTEDSYIELEIFPRYEYRQDIEFTSRTPIEITIAEPTENIYPTVADLMFWEDTEIQITASNITYKDGYRMDLDGSIIEDEHFLVAEVILDSTGYTGIESSFWVDTFENGRYPVYSFFNGEGELIATANNNLYNTFKRASSFRCFAPMFGGVRKVCISIYKPTQEDIYINFPDISKSIINGNDIYTVVPSADILRSGLIVYLRPEDSWGPMYNYKTRYSSDYFDIVSHYDRGDIKVETTDETKPVEFTRLSRFSITPKADLILNKPLTLTFTKIPAMCRFTVDVAGYTMIELQTDDFQFNMNYLRIFRNGRLLPNHRYRMLTNYERPRIIFNIWFDIGDIIYIDITPYKYKKIYHADNIDVDHALIDLKDIINKPFDIRYYDVYLNGRKLSVNNVFAITPWSIALVNIKTGYNLDIYERERDWEYFGIDYTKNNYYFSFDNLTSSGLVNEEEYRRLVKEKIDSLKDSRLNIYPNEDIESRMNYSDVPAMIYVVFHIFYYNELIPQNFLNPDIKQIDMERLITDFTEIYEYYKCHPCDGVTDLDDFARKRNYPGVICLDPDVYINSPEIPEGDRSYVDMRLTETPGEPQYDEDDNVLINIDVGDDDEVDTNPDGSIIYNINDNDVENEESIEANNGVIVYEVGHVGDIPQEYLDQEIHMILESTIDKD